MKNSSLLHFIVRVVPPRLIEQKTPAHLSASDDVVSGEIHYDYSICDRGNVYKTHFLSGHMN